MLVDKKKFKELKKDDGGALGFECSFVAKILEAEDLIKVDTCNVSIHPKGLYMDFLLRYKLYFSLENLQEVKLNNGVIEIYIENELPIKMKIEKTKDVVKVYNTLKTHLGEEDEKIDLKYLKEKEKADMERLRKAGRTVHPSEQRSYSETPQYDSDVARCPKCKSTSITANKKGFSLAKGALGVATVGLYGVVAAGHGKNKVIVTCLKCGHQWKAGK
ncbi:hypothetical protein ACQPUZ_16350 [Clostridium tertium]